MNGFRKALGFIAAVGIALWRDDEGAVTVATVFNGVNRKIFSVIATADGDVAAVIPHGLGLRPGFLTTSLRIIFVPTITLVSALSGWTLGVVDATNVNLVATAAAGSGNVGVQLLVEVALPHSIEN